MASTDKAEKISITLPTDMLNTIKGEVQSGAYGSTSEVIRDAMRLWQRQQEEHKARMHALRDRLDHSANSGDPVPMEQAFDQIAKLHQKRTADQ